MYVKLLLNGICFVVISYFFINIVLFRMVPKLILKLRDVVGSVRQYKKEIKSIMVEEDNGTTENPDYREAKDIS